MGVLGAHCHPGEEASERAVGMLSPEPAPEKVTLSPWTRSSPAQRAVGHAALQDGRG